MSSRLFCISGCGSYFQTCNCTKLSGKRPRFSFAMSFSSIGAACGPQATTSALGCASKERCARALSPALVESFRREVEQFFFDGRNQVRESLVEQSPSSCGTGYLDSLPFPGFLDESTIQQFLAIARYGHWSKAVHLCCFSFRYLGILDFVQHEQEKRLGRGGQFRENFSLFQRLL